MYVPMKTRVTIMKSEHDSKVAGHFRRVRIKELISRNFYWPKMEDKMRKFGN